MSDARGGTVLLEAARDDAGPRGDRVIATSWLPHDYQEGVLAHDTGIDFLIGGIGSAKSQVGAQKTLWWSLLFPQRADGEPSRGLVMGKDYRNSEKNQFRKIVQQARKLPIPVRHVIRSIVGGKEPSLTFWNGVVLEAFSGSREEGSRSSECDFAWFDEGEHMSPLSFMNGLNRLRAASGMRAIVTSNPGGGAWIYPLISGEYEQWKDFVAENEIRVFRWASEQNKALDRRQLRRLRAAQEAIRPGSAVQEFGGRYLGTSEAPGTGPVEWARQFVGRVEILERDTRATVCAADLGKSVDYCWFTAVNSRSTVLAQERFNIGDIDLPPELYWSAAAERFLRFRQRWGAPIVVVDTAKGGDQFASSIREKLALSAPLVRVVEYGTDAPGRRSKLIEALAKAIELGRWRVPTAWCVRGGPFTQVAEVEMLRKEWKKLIITDEKNDKRSFRQGLGAHDDGVISNGLALHGLPANAESVDWSKWNPPEAAAGRFSS